ncbi:unnamed protein product, partial [Medioppia subpectinata]
MSRSPSSAIRHLLTGLGRATQRGVRKCPKCHVYNGTRGTKCKNKACDHVFSRQNGHKTGAKGDDQQSADASGGPSLSTIANLESIRCITANNSSNVYSVRVRDRGPDYRGFVEVPIIRGLDGTSDPSLNPQFIAETTARCFVEVCGTHKVVLPITATTTTKPRDSSAAASGAAHGHHHHRDHHRDHHHQRTGSSSSGSATNIRLTVIESCVHIKHSVRCATDARPVALKNSVLNRLPITDHMRQQIAELAFDTPGPLVQRVSRTSMVVKCKANNKQPLGYLHCWFAQTSPPPADKSKATSHSSGVCLPMKFSCVCKAFKAFKCANNQSINSNNNKVSDQTIDSRFELSAERKCVHYYACICAFASDSDLGREFRHYIVKELPDFVCISPPHTPDIGSARNDGHNSTDQSANSNKEVINTGAATHSDSPVPNKKLKTQSSLVDNGNADAIHTRKLIDRGIITESDISINFVEWLSSVTELINQTMHYQLSGKPEQLVWRIPQCYFDCLQQRIATGLRKKRLPNMTTVFTRKDRPPLGTFTKYTYLITNISHVKQLFDTSRQSLALEQHFVQNRDGSFDFAHSSATAADLSDTAMDGSALVLPQNDNQLIKPSELKTFLKVGLMSGPGLAAAAPPSSSQSSSGSDTSTKETAIPFVIEWIPDCLPASHFGELRIELQFGHIRNGNIDHHV